MCSGSAWTGIHDIGVEVTNSLWQRITCQYVSWKHIFDPMQAQTSFLKLMVYKTMIDNNRGFRHTLPDSIKNKILLVGLL